jgi:tetratricopeptide (TPR) repeat protein
VGSLCYRSAMNCSATSVSLLLAALVAHEACAAGVAELDDAAARMQYAFYTSDSRGIETTLKELEEFQVEETLAAAKSYQLAYGNWKLSQLYLQPLADARPRPSAKSLAAKAAQTCVRHARHAVEQDAALAEALAIEAACEGHSPNARSGSAGCANSKPLRTAAGLAPDNPRVKLVQALCAPNTAADPAAVDRWRAVVASFEAAPPSRPGKPDWGHVEALTILGETYLQRGDPVAARDALERALVLAPDYRQAQQLLQAAATRPR